jgi:hypothetical protein
MARREEAAATGAAEAEAVRFAAGGTQPPVGSEG